MRRHRTLALLAGILVSLPCALLGRQEPVPTTASTFTVSGTMVDHRSGQPLAGVRVGILPVQQSDEPQSDQLLACVTNGDGRFVFDKVPAGKYSLFAKARGFDEQAFRGSENYSTAIAVGPGLDSEHIIFPLTPAGSISGSVVDEEGEPVRQAQVWLFHRGVWSGRSQITMANNQLTDAAGSFHFGHLAPGTYFVGLQGRPWYAENTPGSDLDLVYPITYYAGTEDPAAASPITIAEGGSVTIPIALHPVRALHVQISEVGASAPTNVSQEGPGGYPLSLNTSVSSSDAGTEINGLPPGRYT